MLTLSNCALQIVSEGEEPMSSIKFHTPSRVEESMNMSFKVPVVVQQGATIEDAVSPTESMAGLLPNSAVPEAIVGRDGVA